MKTIAAARFKATCLAVMSEVQAKREPLIITKNGRPMVKMVPLPISDEDPIFGFYRGKLDLVGDVMSPLYSDEDYQEFFDRSAAQLK
jgi:prevent-host-death family protein